MFTIITFQTKLSMINNASLYRFDTPTRVQSISTLTDNTIRNNITRTTIYFGTIRYHYRRQSNRLNILDLVMRGTIIEANSYDIESLIISSIFFNQSHLPIIPQKLVSEVRII